MGKTASADWSRSLDNTRDFAARVTILGPQWAMAGDTPYLCYTPIQGDRNRFIAKTPEDYRLYRVDPFKPNPEVILATNPALGETLPPGRHVSLDFVLQTIAEAWLFGPELGQPEEYARYIVTVWIVGQLIAADDFTTTLIDLLVLRRAATGDLRTFQNDLSGSRRLRAAWVEGLVALASDRIDSYESAK